MADVKAVGDYGTDEDFDDAASSKSGGSGEGGESQDSRVSVVLPPEVQRRVKALKNLQVATLKVEADFFKELHVLENKFWKLYQPLYEKRNTIVQGSYEPTDAESDFPTDSDAELAEKTDKMEVNGNAPVVPTEPVKGVPDFWLTIFQNTDILAEMIEEDDEPILKHLTDVKYELTMDPMGFKLYFHFSPNEYFTNTVLEKTYEMKFEVDPKDPWEFEGPEIVKSIGTKIDWKEGKNVTVKTIKKKQKHKQTGHMRVIDKTTKCDSFFNFFSPPEMPEGDEVDDHVKFELTSDYEVGEYIRERVIPRAVLFFTGEALEDEEDEYDDEEDEEETDEEEPRLKNGIGAV